MKAIGSVIRAPLKMLGLVKSPPKPAAPLPSATRDLAQDRRAQEDELRRRRGGAADMLTGPDGAEAGTTGKTTMG